MHTYTNLSVDKILKPISYYVQNSSLYQDSLYVDIRNKVVDSFKELKFEEEGHKYTLNGKNLIAVSHVCHLYEEKQDFAIIAQRYAKKHNLPDWKEIKRQWDCKGLIGNNGGSFAHEYAEGFHHLLLGELDKIPIYSKRQICENYYIPFSPKQEAVVKYFYDILNEGEVPLLSEIRTYWEELGISGTFDSLIYSTEIEGIIIRDYKTNEKLRNSYLKPLFPPLNYLNNEDLSFYIIQLNLYQIMLENIGIEIKRREIVWLKDDKTYELISLPDITSLLRLSLPKLLNV